MFEVRLQTAREQGRVEGLEAGALLGSKVTTGEVAPADVTSALREALTSPEPLRVDGLALPVAQLPTRQAERVVATVEQALATVTHECIDHECTDHECTGRACAHGAPSPSGGSPRTHRQNRDRSGLVTTRSAHSLA